MMERGFAKIIEKTVVFVRERLLDAEAGHNWFHTERVWKNARLILQTEQADRFVVELAALLHDIADSKFHDGNEEMGPEMAGSFLLNTGVDESTVRHVQDIIRYMSYRSGIGGQVFSSPELRVVQDADRLDAIGAIGIARAFHYGGFKNREIYDPAVTPQKYADKEAYKLSAAPTINHFYEKLLLLKDLMHSDTARRIAEERHQFMESYLQQFYREWNGEI